ncbi:iron ABC transporter permease [Oscillospiraceae bacterium HV4-5-C5C]|nr:iron ABC transporter permease [Oscillospiraceae bacterium HV4-5-C5C]
MIAKVTVINCRRRPRFDKAGILIPAALLPLTLLSGLLVGYTGISPRQLWDCLWGTASPEISLIIWQIRLPRLIVAALCGAGLALSGAALQALTHNPLADPSVLGINAGSGFSVMVYLSYFSFLHLNSLFWQPVFALAGGLVSAGLLWLLSRHHGRLDPRLLILVGIGLAAFFSALMLVMGSNMENNSYQMVARWLAGNLWGSSWYQVRILWPWLLLLVPLMFAQNMAMDVLNLGAPQAQALGLAVNRERIRLLLLAVALAAVSISVCGGIAFIGLAAPHIARRLTATTWQAQRLPATFLWGTLLLPAADTLGRCLPRDIEIPAGIVTALLAAPYFLYLLRQPEKSGGKK